MAEDPTSLFPDERTKIAEHLMALVFSLRPSNDEKGQAWVLTIGATTMARAVLASVGPHGDFEALLALSFQQVRQIIDQAQLKAAGAKLSLGN